MKIKALGLILLACLVFLIGCSGKNNKFETVIKSYNENLSLALKRQDPELVTRYTSNREKIRVKLYLEYLTQEQKAILDSKLKKLTLGDVKVNGDKAEATAQEEWTFKYLDLESRKETKAAKEQNYRSTYYLVKNDKKEWVVDAVDIGMGNPNQGPYGTSDKAFQSEPSPETPSDKK